MHAWSRVVKCMCGWVWSNAWSNACMAGRLVECLVENCHLLVGHTNGPCGVSAVAFCVRRMTRYVESHRVGHAQVRERRAYVEKEFGLGGSVRQSLPCTRLVQGEETEGSGTAKTGTGRGPIWKILLERSCWTMGRKYQCFACGSAKSKKRVLLPGRMELWFMLRQDGRLPPLNPSGTRKRKRKEVGKSRG